MLVERKSGRGLHTRHDGWRDQKQTATSKPRRCRRWDVVLRERTGRAVPLASWTEGVEVGEELRSWNGSCPRIESGDGTRWCISGREEERVRVRAAGEGIGPRMMGCGTDNRRQTAGLEMQSKPLFGGEDRGINGGARCGSTQHKIAKLIPGPSHRWRLPVASPKFLDLVGERDRVDTAGAADSTRPLPAERCASTSPA